MFYHKDANQFFLEHGNKYPALLDQLSLSSNKYYDNPLNSIRRKRNWLQFNDIDHFEAAIHELEKRDEDYLREFEFRQRFTSLRSIYEINKTEEIEFWDDEDIDDEIIDHEPLSAVLNTEGIVEIGNKIYKIDIDNNKLIIFPSYEAGRFQTSQFLPVHNNYISINLDDDFSDEILFSNTVNIENSGIGNQGAIVFKKIGCKGCDGNVVKGKPYVEYKTRDGVYRFKTKASYRNFGIYKRLQLKIKHQYKEIGSNGRWKLIKAPNLTFFADAAYTRRCKNSFSKRIDHTEPNKRKHKINIYSGALKLSYFKVENIYLGGEGLDELLHETHLSDLICA